MGKGEREKVRGEREIDGRKRNRRAKEKSTTKSERGALPLEFFFRVFAGDEKGFSFHFFSSAGLLSLSTSSSTFTKWLSS